MKIRTRLASVAMLAGVAGATLLGGASAAHAAAPGHACAGGAGNTASCSANLIGIPVTIGVTGNRILNGNDIDVIEDSLNDVDLNVLSAKGTLIGVYKSLNLLD
jgi:hypothetical protein